MVIETRAENPNPSLGDLLQTMLPNPQRCKSGWLHLSLTCPLPPL